MPVPQAWREAAARRLLARTRRIPYRGRCNRRDAAWVGGESSRWTPPPARAGAALHRLRIINGRDSPLLIRNGCGTARVARDSRAALTDRRGREPRRDRLRTRPDQFTQPTHCNGRDAAWAGGCAWWKHAEREEIEHAPEQIGRDLARGFSGVAPRRVRSPPMLCFNGCRLRSSGRARVVGCEMVRPDGGLIRRGRC